MDDISIRVRRVRRTFKGASALAGVDLDIGRGITGLLGPNGAGKTTLQRILATVLAPDAGTVRILGRDADRAAERVEIRRRLGYLPQELGYPRGFTAYGFVDYIAVLKGHDDRTERRQAVIAALNSVGLESLSTKRIRALSGGQKRRLALAQALLGKPELLILDEPTTGLDPEQRVSLRGVLAEAGAHSTVLLATHQTEDVAALCDRVVVLDEGQVCFDGSVPGLLASAHGRVWLADAVDPAAQVSWRTADGRYRNVGGHAPAGAELIDPSLEDAYLILRGANTRDAEEVTAA